MNWNNVKRLLNYGMMAIYVVILVFTYIDVHGIV